MPLRTGSRPRSKSFPPPASSPAGGGSATQGRLSATRRPSEGADRYLDDPEAGELAYSSELLSDLNRFTMPQVPITWTRFADEHRVAYETEPLDQPLVIAGAGHVDLWLAPGTEDTAVQVTLTEIRPDGMEQRIQSGWHRPVHRCEDPAHSDELRVDYTFTLDDRRAVGARGVDPVPGPDRTREPPVPTRQPTAGGHLDTGT